MDRNRTIALVAGAVLTLAVFVCCMGLLYFGNVFPERDKLVMVSIALAPVVLVSVMVGFAFWWGVLFLLTLLIPRRDDRGAAKTK